MRLTHWQWARVLNRCEEPSSDHSQAETEASTNVVLSEDEQCDDPTYELTKAGRQALYLTFVDGSVGTKVRPLKDLPIPQVQPKQDKQKDVSLERDENELPKTQKHRDWSSAESTHVRRRDSPRNRRDSPSNRQRYRRKEQSPERLRNRRDSSECLRARRDSSEYLRARRDSSERLRTRRDSSERVRSRRESSDRIAHRGSLERFNNRHSVDRFSVDRFNQGDGRDDVEQFNSRHEQLNPRHEQFNSRHEQLNSRHEQLNSRHSVDRPAAAPRDSVDRFARDSVERFNARHSGDRYKGRESVNSRDRFERYPDDRGSRGLGRRARRGSSSDVSVGDKWKIPESDMGWNQTAVSVPAGDRLCKTDERAYQLLVRLSGEPIWDFVLSNVEEAPLEQKLRMLIESAPSPVDVAKLLLQARGRKVSSVFKDQFDCAMKEEELRPMCLADQITMNYLQQMGRLGSMVERLKQSLVIEGALEEYYVNVEESLKMTKIWNSAVSVTTSETASADREGSGPELVVLQVVSTRGGPVPAQGALVIVHMGRPQPALVQHIRVGGPAVVLDLLVFQPALYDETRSPPEPMTEERFAKLFRSPVQLQFELAQPVRPQELRDLFASCAQFGLISFIENQYNRVPPPSWLLFAVCSPLLLPLVLGRCPSERPAWRSFCQSVAAEASKQTQTMPMVNTSDFFSGILFRPSDFIKAFAKRAETDCDPLKVEALKRETFVTVLELLSGNGDVRVAFDKVLSADREMVILEKSRAPNVQAVSRALRIGCASIVARSRVLCEIEASSVTDFDVIMCHITQLENVFEDPMEVIAKRTTKTWVASAVVTTCVATNPNMRTEQLKVQRYGLGFESGPSYPSPKFNRLTIPQFLKPLVTWWLDKLQINDMFELSRRTVWVKSALDICYKIRAWQQGEPLRVVFRTDACRAEDQKAVELGQAIAMDIRNVESAFLCMWWMLFIIRRFGPFAPRKSATRSLQTFIWHSSEVSWNALSADQDLLEAIETALAPLEQMEGLGEHDIELEILESAALIITCPDLPTSHRHLLPCPAQVLVLDNDEPINIARYVIGRPRLKKLIVTSAPRQYDSFNSNYHKQEIWSIVSMSGGEQFEGPTDNDDEFVDEIVYVADEDYSLVEQPRFPDDALVISGDTDKDTRISNQVW